MIKAVIFDLDGVVVSTDELHYQAWKKIADEEKIYFDRFINHRLRGVNRANSLDIILERAGKTYSQKEKEILMEKKNNIYVASLSSLSPKDILKGVYDLLISLKNKGIIVAIGSSSKNAKKILERIELETIFDYVSDGTMIERSKPFPDVFENVRRHYCLKPEECIVIEDAKSGIDAAKNAKMIAVAVGDAKSYDKADWKLENMSDLLDIIVKY